MTSARATFFHYLAGHRLQLLVGVCLAAGSSLAAVVPPRFIGEIIDALQKPGVQFDDVLHLALLIVLFAAVEAALRAGARYVMLDASRKAEYRMRNDLFAHLQRMHLAYFQHQRIGDLMARMTNDLTWVRQMMGPGIMQGSFTVMVFTFAVLSMVSVSLKLTVIALILMPLASLTFCTSDGRSIRDSRSCSRSSAICRPKRRRTSPASAS